MPDIYTLGAARVTDASGSNILPVVKLQLEVDPESGDAEDFGEVPLMPCLGLTALPAPPDDDGRAEGLAIEGVGGFTAVVAGARDARCVDVVGQLGPGETALHSTGGSAGKRSRVFCKENSLSGLIGTDTGWVLDRGEGLFTITINKQIRIQIDDSAKKITVAPNGNKAWIEIVDGTINLMGGVNGGNAAAQSLTMNAALAAAITTLAAAMTTIGAAPLTGAALAGALTTMAGTISATAGTTLMRGI